MTANYLRIIDTLQQLTRKQITEWKDTKIYFLRSTGWICHKYLIPTKISSYTAVYKCETQFDFSSNHGYCMIIPDIKYFKFYGECTIKISSPFNDLQKDMVIHPF